MKIQCIKAYQVDLPLYEGSYNWSGGKSVSVFDSTIVSVETDVGITGYGEVCPLGPFYLPAYATGTRTGIAELAPHLIGEDPTQLLPLNQRMDIALKGHPYVKSGIDIACWDILGKVSNQSVCTLLGGRYGEDFMLYRAISQQAPDEMAAKVATYRAEGYRKFQLKVGGDPNTDIERIRRGCRIDGTRRCAHCRCEYRLVDARGRPCCSRCTRCGCLYRATLPLISGMPRHSPAHKPPLCSRRDD